MMGLVIAVLWAAAAYRLWVSLSQQRTVWRSAFTAATVCCALGFTLDAASERLDQWIGIVNFAELLSHVVVAIGLGCLLILLRGLRGQRLDQRKLISDLSVALLFVIVMVLAWVWAPVHDQQVDDLLEWSQYRAVVVYSLTFWLLLGVSLVLMAWTCFARGRTFRREDPARSASLLLVGCAAVASVPVVVLWSLSMILRHIGRPGSSHLNAIGDAILPWPLLINSVGVLALLIVPYVTDFRTARREWSSLAPLWQSMIQVHPEVHLPIHPTGGPVARLQMRVERAIIEIHDALRVTTVRLPTETSPTLDQVGAALHQPTTDGSSVADVLEQSDNRQADVDQLSALAKAYERAR